MGSPLRVMVLGPWLKVIWGIEKSTGKGPKELSHARPKIPSALASRKIKNGMVKGVFLGENF